VAEQVRALLATVARYHDTFRNADGTWTLARRSREFTG